jgi:hypothetical protein
MTAGDPGETVERDLPFAAAEDPRYTAPLARPMPQGYMPAGFVGNAVTIMRPLPGDGDRGLDEQEVTDGR